MTNSFMEVVGTAAFTVERGRSRVTAHVALSADVRRCVMSMPANRIAPLTEA